jgi:hypothetical protein
MAFEQLAEARRQRNIHSHRYHGEPDQGHWGCIDFLNRVAEESANYLLLGAPAFLPTVAKALKTGRTAPRTPVELPHPGYLASDRTVPAPDRTSRLLDFSVVFHAA